MEHEIGKNMRAQQNRRLEKKCILRGFICEGCDYCEVAVFSSLKMVAPCHSETLVNVYRLLNVVTSQNTQNLEHQNLYSSKVTKARKMKWAGLIARKVRCDGKGKGYPHNRPLRPEG